MATLGAGQLERAALIAALRRVSGGAPDGGGLGASRPWHSFRFGQGMGDMDPRMQALEDLFRGLAEQQARRLGMDGAPRYRYPGDMQYLPNQPPPGTEGSVPFGQYPLLQRGPTPPGWRWGKPLPGAPGYDLMA